MHMLSLIHANGYGMASTAGISFWSSFPDVATGVILS